MQIIFTRHGESQANVAGIISNRTLPHHLTGQGQRQAHTLSDKLNTKNIVAIYTSPILRAKQTARIIAAKRHLPVHLVDALREFDCGIMEGRDDEEAWQAHEAVIRAWDDEQDYGRRIPDGESFNDMQARFEPFIKQLIETFAYGDGDIVLVSHGSLLHQMLPMLLSNVDRVFTKDHPLGNCACVVVTRRQETLICLEWDGVHLG